MLKCSEVQVEGVGGRVARLAGECQMALEAQRDDFSVSIQQLTGLWPS